MLLELHLDKSTTRRTIAGYHMNCTTVPNYLSQFFLCLSVFRCVYFRNKIYLVPCLSFGCAQKGWDVRDGKFCNLPKCINYQIVLSD